MNIYQVIGAVLAGAVIGTYAGVKLAQYLIVKRTRAMIAFLEALKDDETPTNNSILTIDEDN